MPHGGKRAGAGRPRKLDDSVKEAIAREYRQMMQAWAAARQMGRDPKRRKRIAILEKVVELAEEHPPLSFSQHEKREGEIYFYGRASHLFKPLQAKLNKLDKDKRAENPLPQPKVTFPLQRARGPRNRFIKELAEKWKVSRRTVVSCIDET
jgi:hypothetical protein